jgi:transcriptional regulator with XRE-family HTH domain
MNQSPEEYRDAFQDEQVRYAVAEDFLSVYIAAQIKELRGNRSQQEIADAIGTKQSGISRLENVNYSSWEAETLRKLARAFGVRLKISFEEFGTLLAEMDNFNKETIRRRRFEDDPAFKEPFHQRRRRRIRSSQRVIEHTGHRRKRLAVSKATRKPPVVEYGEALPVRKASGSGATALDFSTVENGNNSAGRYNPPPAGGIYIMSGNNAYGK